ncbi:RNA polymerase sigma factor [Kordiimonas laminariae]|uniref:RNA polymerase sigma factor n=1 Tax=Kordiimonas laminariae TaxID=2917717 RepID=UPI001FF5A44D|nr:RNA polymerase sigma factor [Kordiimonas laminariae]MCK0070927.1 RNA polymerase sigma factor [Kordiimonas laminariae]
MQPDILDIVKLAQCGNQEALSDVVGHVQDQVYRLAMRMLVNPDDAGEATQEILILVVTKLSTFEGRSQFSTWVYKVAVNYLLSAKRSLERNRGLNFDVFQADLEDGLLVDPTPAADDLVLLNELRIACTSALLLCLPAEQRMAYILGDVFELEHNEAAEALDISRENYRKRLSRARKQVVSFTGKVCGLANSAAKCSCPKRLPKAKELGRVNEEHLAYAVDDAPAYKTVQQDVEKLVDDLKVLKLQRATAHYQCPQKLVKRVEAALYG